MAEFQYHRAGCFLPLPLSSTLPIVLLLKTPLPPFKKINHRIEIMVAICIEHQGYAIGSRQYYQNKVLSCVFVSKIAILSESLNTSPYQ